MNMRTDEAAAFVRFFDSNNWIEFVGEKGILAVNMLPKGLLRSKPYFAMYPTFNLG